MEPKRHFGQPRRTPVLTRRHLFHVGLATGCAACAALAAGRLSSALAADPATPAEIEGPGYALRFVGSQRETIMLGKRAALLDLRTLKDRPHVYGIGPLEGLTGEVTIANGRPALARVGSDHRVHVTESYEGGVPFFVWAEVSDWQTVTVPSEVRTFKDLETFIGSAGAKAGLVQAFPFVVTGKPDLIDFHIVDAKPDTPPGMADHAKIQIQFDLRRQDVTLVGFWSSRHQGIFTPMGANMHVHFQTADNKVSGHVQGLDLAPGGMTLSLPKG
jgi:acetolactate decarboxylase